MTSFHLTGDTASTFKFLNLLKILMAFVREWMFKDKTRKYFPKFEMFKK